MGGVLIREFQIANPLMKFLGRSEKGFGEISGEIREALRSHSCGLLDETEFWDIYCNVTGDSLPETTGSLLGRFFNPTLDIPTVRVVEDLKGKGMRVVCGTNVIDSHYRIHMEHSDYQVFDTVYASHILGVCKPNLEQNVDVAAQVGIHAYMYVDSNTLQMQLASLGILEDHRNGHI
jgi:putative hydrolase of the HAD superfamily